jgi:hypothetical protein
MDVALVLQKDASNKKQPDRRLRGFPHREGSVAPQSSEITRVRLVDESWFKAERF